MNFFAIRLTFWLVMMAMPFAAYSISGIDYPPETRTITYVLAIGGVLVGTVSKLPLRAGSDPTLFPVRAASGCSSLLAPVGALVIVWLIPHLAATTTKLIVLFFASAFIISLLAFATISGVLKGTPRP
jgi:hypothetical protein